MRLLGDDELGKARSGVWERVEVCSGVFLFLLLVEVEVMVCEKLIELNGLRLA